MNEASYQIYNIVRRVNYIVLTDASQKSTHVQRGKELGYANKLCIHTGYMSSFKLKNIVPGVPPNTKLFHRKGCQNYKSCC